MAETVMAAFHVVVKGDTFTTIAPKYNTTVKKLQQLNPTVKDGNKLTVGSKIQVSGTISSTAAKTSSTNNSNKVKFDEWGEQANAPRTMYATWTWTKKHVDYYDIKWYYATGDGIWFNDAETTTKYKQTTYSPRANATKVKLKVKPVSTKDKVVNKKKTYHWKADWNEKTYTFKDDPSEKPPTPELTVENYKLTATVRNIPQFYFGTHIKFEFVRDDTKVVMTTEYIPITLTVASTTYTAAPGYEYKVRVKGGKVVNGKCVEDSDWTDFSSAVKTVPAEIKAAPKLKALSETEIEVSWTEIGSAESYEIQYTTDKSRFNMTGYATSTTVEKTTTAYIGGLSSGDEYFFRMRAINNVGESSWSPISSIIIGKEPAAPTTWSSTTTAVLGEELILYWLHNSQDNSTQTKAEIEITSEVLNSSGKTEKKTIVYKCEGCGEYKIDSAGNITRTKEYTTDEDKTLNCICRVDISKYSEGASLQWRVRTAGITGVYNSRDGWSIMRTVDIYAPPYFETFEITDYERNPFSTLECFPFYMHAVPGPRTQNPVGYYVSVTANDSYTYTDQIGNEQSVKDGDLVFSKYYDTSSDILVQFTPADIDLENGVSYTVTCIASMSSGLTAEEKVTFYVSWEDIMYVPNAEIHINDDNLTAIVRPYCGEYPWLHYRVTYDASTDTYTKTDVILEELDGDWIEDASLADGELVFKGTTSEGVEEMFCLVESEELELIDGVTLSVYRREYDGKFTELATNLKNKDMTFVTDPHPSLDYARYRIVAITESTGAVGFYDLPGEPVGEPAIVIQWAEEWSTFNVNEEDELEDQPWEGSLLKLPYNVDVSDNNDPDVSLIGYIGRENPVSYYGTQIGTKATWSTEIPKDDAETLYALRRLSRWMGDVYVREPSGSGYWANIKVSFSQTHKELTIPISLDITRVEGGV